MCDIAPSPPPSVVTVVVLEIRTVLRAQALKKLRLQMEKGAVQLSKAEQSLVEGASKSGRRPMRRTSVLPGSAVASAQGLEMSTVAPGSARNRLYVPAEEVNVVTEVRAVAGWGFRGVRGGG
jgi:hypothetical protein